MQDHKRDEVGADGHKNGLQNGASSERVAATSNVETASARSDQTMEAERPLETADREQPACGELRLPAEPTSPEGRQREGIHETGGKSSGISSDSSEEVTPSMKDTVTDTDVPTTIAYTASQRPNLPESGLPNADNHAESQGSGRMQEAVERRANQLIFDPVARNFMVKDGVHGTGVTSQDKT